MPLVNRNRRKEIKIEIMNPEDVVGRVIYALIDPRDDRIRYIGKTDNMLKRYGNHLCPSNSRKRRHVSAWILSLRRKGLKPMVSIVQYIKEGDNWEELESFWIARLRSEGYDLCNHATGGEGGNTCTPLNLVLKPPPDIVGIIKNSSSRRGKKMPSRHYSLEARKRRGDAIKAHWDKVKENGGKKYQPKMREETKEKMRKNHNPISNANLRGRKKGYKSDNRQYNNEQIQDIRRRAENGESQVSIARLYNTSQSLISSIVNFKVYKEVT